MALSTDLQIKLTSEETSALDLVTTRAPLSFVHRTLLATGTGDDQADLLFSDNRTLGASATEDLDLAASLTTALGTAFTPATVKAIIVTGASGNTNNVNVTRPSSNGVPLFLAASDGIAVKPGGAFVWVAPDTGITVTASTGDLLTFTNSGVGSSVTYSVIIFGTSA